MKNISGDIRFLLEICNNYYYFLKKLFESINSDLSAIDSAQLEVLSSYYAGKTSEKFKNMTIDEIVKYFKFSRINVIYKKKKSGDDFFNEILTSLEKYHIKYAHLDIEVGFAYPLNAANLLENYNNIKSKIDELNFVIDDKKRNKK